MIALITPTGARAKQMELCLRWMEAQTYQGEVLWVIVDDAKPVTTDIVKEYFRPDWVVVKIHPDNPTWIPGMNTQARNLLAGMEEVEEWPEITSVFIIEDDDYYSPTYLSKMVNELETSKLVGEVNCIYYHVANRRCYKFKEGSHSALFQTAFDNSLASVFESVLKNEKEAVAIDVNFWKRVKEGKKLLRLDKPMSVGIKGMSGRNGIGNGHLLAARDMRSFDPSKTKLETLLGEDYKAYEST